jgi:substrate import-associated zinc metallohydrolase lipoprotein
METVNHKNNLLHMKKICFALILMLAVSACKEGESLNPDGVLLGMGGDTWEKTELDKWLDEEFVEPYNIEVKYKWDPYEAALQKPLVPIDEEQVKPLMTAIKKVWLDSYEITGGKTFIKTMSPKCFVLMGSREYSTTTSTITGMAYGTNKIVILGVNEFAGGGEMRVLKTVAHEFAHILHHTVMYPEEWLDICADSYYGDWGALTTPEATRNGFVSRYARMNGNEDFVETVAYIMLKGKDWFEEYVAEANAVSGNVAGARLKRKEAMLITYFKTVWNIDFYESAPGKKDGLVYRAQAAVSELGLNSTDGLE